MAAIPVNYSQFQKIKRTVGDNNVLQRVDITTIVAPANGASYLASVSAGIFTQDRLYVHDSGSWFELQPGANSYEVILAIGSGLFRMDNSGTLQPYQLTSNINNSLQSVQAAPQALLAATLTQLSGFNNLTVTQIGAVSGGDTLNVDQVGNYAIQLSSDNIVGAIIGLEILNSTTGKLLASSQGVDISRRCSCSYAGRLDPAHNIIFNVISSMVGNVTCTLDVVRYA